jgi:hypothetical protein
VDVATPVGTFTFDCVEPSSAGTGVQGTTILDVPEGLRSFTITGWRGNTAVYRHTVSLDVARGLSDVEGYRVDVEPITAPIDLFAYLYSVEADRFYTTCTEAGRPDIFYDVYDSFGTLILSEEAACTATTIADPVLVYANDLDLDNYTVRMAGYTTFVDPVFDSCTQAFDHFSAQTGEAGIAITLDTPPSCP